jgi:molybdenum cofactor synthesis domain-containing protein
MRVEDAVGLPLGHDITEINVDRGIKRRAFRRGHVIRPEDLERLRDLGKNLVFVASQDQAVDEDEVHEDDVARLVAPLVAGENVLFDEEPVEGKISFRAACPGLFQVDVERLFQVNSLEVPALPTIPTDYPVAAGQTVAAFRIIPLTCRQEIVDKLRAVLGEALLRVRPYTVPSAAVLVTGNEVYEGRIEDRFVGRLTATLAAFGVPVEQSAVLPDDRERIARAVTEAAARHRLVLVTGGTSVDPDDVTVLAMADAGVRWQTRGMPVQPGNNFTLGYLEEAAVCAVPAATLFHRATALDLFLPRLLAGVRVTREEIFRMGHGGLAQSGTDDHFPNCTFGQGR